MAKQEGIVVEGIAIEALKDGKFSVELENKHIVLCHPCGKIRKNNIKITLGDKLTVELSPYDLSRGIIKFRNK